MTAMSDFLEDGLGEYIFRGVAAPSLAASLSIALYTAAPGETGGGTEVTGGSYARVSVTRNTTEWTDPGTDGLVDNVNAIVFPTASANWGTVVAVGIFSSTDLLFYGALGTSKAVNSGDTAQFNAGALDITLA